MSERRRQLLFKDFKNDRQKYDLRGRDEQFAAWGKTAQRRGFLDPVVRTVQTQTGCADVSSALDHLENVVANANINGEASMRVTDLLGKTAPFYNLKKLFPPSKPEADHETLDTRFLRLQYGALGHRAIVNLLRGDIGEQERKLREGVITDIQPELFNQSDLSIYQQPPDMMDENGLSPEYVAQISDNLTILQMMGSEEIIDESTSNGVPHYATVERFDQLLGFEPAIFAENLERLMAPVFPDQHSEMVRFSSRLGVDGFFVPMLMSMATAVVDNYGQPPRALFTEVPVMNWSRNGMDGGRIDALEVTSIHQQPPDEYQVAYLQEMAHNSYASNGDLISNLRNEIGDDFTARIIDFKFSIGDAPKGGFISQRSIEKGPLEEHCKQLRRYLTLGPIDIYTTQTAIEDRDWDESEVWGDDILSEAEIDYFHPLVTPIIHRLSLSQEEKIDNFRREIVIDLDKAQRQAGIRHTSNVVSNFMHELIAGQDENGKKPRRTNIKSMDSGLLDFMQRMQSVTSQHNAL